MYDWVRQKVFEILRLPPEPGVPEGTPASVLTFRAGRNLYRWLVLVWAFSHLGVVGGAIFAYYFTWRLIDWGPNGSNFCMALRRSRVCSASPLPCPSRLWPIQKLLGIANIEVRAAGGGGAGRSSERNEHVARFEGVDNAAAIRDLIVERLRTYRDLGLGGGGECRESGTASPNAVILTGLQGSRDGRLCPRIPCQPDRSELSHPI